jgi:hypothetical protein
MLYKSLSYYSDDSGMELLTPRNKPPICPAQTLNLSDRFTLYDTLCLLALKIQLVQIAGKLVCSIRIIRCEQLHNQLAVYHPACSVESRAYSKRHIVATYSALDTCHVPERTKSRTVRLGELLKAALRDNTIHSNQRHHIADGSQAGQVKEVLYIEVLGLQLASQPEHQVPGQASSARNRAGKMTPFLMWIDKNIRGRRIGADVMVINDYGLQTKGACERKLLDIGCTEIDGEKNGKLLLRDLAHRFFIKTIAV